MFARSFVTALFIALGLGGFSDSTQAQAQEFILESPIELVPPTPHYNVIRTLYRAIVTMPDGRSLREWYLDACQEAQPCAEANSLADRIESLPKLLLAAEAAHRAGDEKEEDRLLNQAVREISTWSYDVNNWMRRYVLPPAFQDAPTQGQSRT